MKALCLIAISLPSLCFAAPKTKTGEFHQAKAITKISFGACNDPRKGESPMYEAILKHEPDVFVWLGDNIYGDTEDMELFKTKYDELGAQPGFQKLREATTMLATWDDHDYGVNDGGNCYKMRGESQQLFLDFFQDPADSPRRKREGVHASYTFGESDKVCQILVLDTRYFRDVLPRSKKKKAPNTVGWYEPTEDTSMTLLGDAQWKWLEEQLQVPANLRIIASSIQMLAVEKGMENWGNVPHEQQRFFDLLKKHKAKHTIAISGDVHYAELSKKDIGGYPFYDLTSSGMTNVSKGWAKATNSMRVSKSHAVQNAGLIEIDWDKRSLELAIINKDAEKILSHPLKFSELEFK
ncbi:MAG: alkaline phosphatase D family protein [Akkermansiaceae bacterium]|nr:alkaline phosphatase D family protein [Akkermansiaceae bacterium]